MHLYSRWKHRITYSLSPVTIVDDRWVTLVLPWRVGIRHDYADIRFSDTAGRALSYEISSKTDGVTATIKINIPTAGTRLIHLYFGNSQAGSESTAAGTDDSNPILTSISGTTNPGYTGKITRVQGGRLNQQGYARGGIGYGPYPQWQHKALIKITNPVSQANYQHKLMLSWLPGMRNDFRDIRFSQINGKKCDYWIESYTSRTSAVVWIEVPTASQRGLNLHYGNGKAVSESSGANTFDFFDDFEDGSIDLTKWSVTSGNSIWSESGGTLINTTSGSADNDWWSSRSVSIIKALGLPSTYIFTVTMSAYAGTNLTLSGLGAYQSDAYTRIICRVRWDQAGYNNIQIQRPGTSESSPAAAIVSSTVQFTAKVSASNNVRFYYSTTIGGSPILLGPDPYTEITPTNIVLVHKEWGNVTESVAFDNAYARKYTATEPTLTLVSHQPNSTRIIPYETLGDQPVSGTTYIMDPIEFGFTVSASMGPTILQPVVSFAHALAVSAPVTKLTTEIDFGYTIAGSVISRNYIPLDQLDLTQISVSKSVSDDIWAMSATIDGYQVLNTDILRHATFATTDHLGVSQSIFAGIIPKSAPVIKDAANKTTLTGYDYAWYLSRQRVPTAYQHNVATVNPADIITGLLGGDDWEETTGIYPFNIQDVSGWGTTLNSKVFDFSVGTTKKAAIDRICTYCRCIFAVKWVVVDGVATAAGYFISEDDIDTELDLPAAVTFTYPDPYLADSIKPVIKGDERYNSVTVIGRDNTGGVFTKTVQSASVTNGDEIAIEYIENSGSWTTQAQVDARAVELYAYYSETAYTYTAKLEDRMDLELLQKIKIVGYTGVSENWMRITKIKKTVRATKDGVEKTVDIEFTENVKWSALKKMYRYSSDDMTSETETIVNSAISAIPGNQVGVVTSITGPTADVTLETGEIVTVRAT